MFLEHFQNLYLAQHQLLVPVGGCDDLNVVSDSVGLKAHSVKHPEDRHDLFVDVLLSVDVSESDGCDCLVCPVEAHEVLPLGAAVDYVALPHPT